MALAGGSLFYKIAGVSGALAVALGAYGSHGKTVFHCEVVPVPYSSYINVFFGSK